MPMARILNCFWKYPKGGSHPTGVHVPKESSMMDTSTQLRRNWLLPITLFLVCCLIGCQAGLAAVPSATETPTPTATATLQSMLRDAPAALAITAVTTAEEETLKLFEYDSLAPLDVEVV